MRANAAVLSILVLVPAVAGAGKAGRLVNEDDEFKGLRSVALVDAEVDLAGGRSLEVRLGKTKTKTSEFALLMLSTDPGDYGKPFIYSDCHDLAFLLDGKPLKADLSTCATAGTTPART